jgi:hypothetical protein
MHSRRRDEISVGGQWGQKAKELVRLAYWGCLLASLAIPSRSSGMPRRDGFTNDDASVSRDESTVPVCEDSWAFALPLGIIHRSGNANAITSHPPRLGRTRRRVAGLCANGSCHWGRRSGRSPLGATPRNSCSRAEFESPPARLLSGRTSGRSQLLRVELRRLLWARLSGLL